MAAGGGEGAVAFEGGVDPCSPLPQACGTGVGVGGFDLSNDYPDLGHALLVCATETRTAADIKAYADALAETLKAAVRAA